MKRQQFLRAAAAAALALGLAPAWAQAYPSKPVRVIIPFPPGGTLDLIGRMLAQKMSEQTGQTFVIENRPGGNGFIGADAVAKAPADGYTLLFNASTFTTGPMVVKSAPYDVNRDFTPVVLVAQAPLAVSVNNDVPAKDIAGLMAHAKANPRQAQLRHRLHRLGGTPVDRAAQARRRRGPDHRAVQGHRARVPGPRRRPDPGLRRPAAGRDELPQGGASCASWP
jgi:hypothetical protein